jgi:predicted transcriptional regulator
MSIVKEEAKKILDCLPEEASWDDVMYEMYARKKIDEGLNAADEGRLISHDEVKKRLLKK